MTDLSSQPPPREGDLDPSFARNFPQKPRVRVSNLSPDLVNLFTKNLPYLFYYKNYLYQQKVIPVSDQSRVNEIAHYFSPIKNGNTIKPCTSFGSRKVKVLSEADGVTYVPFGRQMVKVRKDAVRPKKEQVYIPVLVTVEKSIDSLEELFVQLKRLISSGEICGIADYWHTATLIAGHTLLRPEFKTQVENLLFPVYFVHKNSPTKSRIVSAIKRVDGSSYDFEFRSSDPYQPIPVGSTVLAFKKA